jgi:hypothetical protein
MADRTYLVRLKPPSRSIQHVIAARAEIYDEHLVMINTKGKLVALFLLEWVQSWSEL